MSPHEDNKLTVVLGDEYDQPLRDRLVHALGVLGAGQKSRKAGVGGSQDVEILEYNVADEMIVVESETYVGLSISGSKSLVEKIVGMVKPSK